MNGKLNDKKPIDGVSISNSFKTEKYNKINGKYLKILLVIFISGIFNDVTLGYPIGVSSFIYLTIIAFASYLRNITLRPNIYKDAIVFLIAILFANSVNASILSFIFSIEINYFVIIVNITFTFLLYFLFARMFNYLKTTNI